MKRILIIGSLTVAILTALALTPAAAVNAQEGLDQSCVAACDKIKEDCRWKANGIYVTCGQQGGSETDCAKKRDQAYEECNRTSGCTVCYVCGDWRMGLLGKAYYCKCGNPYYCPSEDDSGCGLTFDGGVTNSCDCNPDDPTCTSPILIDVAGNGFALTDIVRGIWFDIRGDKRPLQIAWTVANTDDAWLALDRNGDDLIGDGTELFGNFTPQPAVTNKHGFLALREYDKPEKGGNGDGLITSADGVFDRLRLWQDKNHNGISESAELLSLAAGNVSQISLDYKETRRKDEYGNLFRYRAKVNGSRSAWDVFLTHQE